MLILSSLPSKKTDNFLKLLIVYLSSTEVEFLALPSSYIPRRLAQHLPKLSRPKSTSSCSSSEDEIVMAPSVEKLSSCVVLNQGDILKTPHTSNLSIIYSLPGYGSTSLLVSLIVQCQLEDKDKWASYLDLRRVAAFLNQNHVDFDENTYTLDSLFIAYNRITSPEAIQTVKSLFAPSTVASSSPKAELFIDELDEIPAKLQSIFLKIILRDVYFKSSACRVWLSTRPHVQSLLGNHFPCSPTFKLLPLSTPEQIELLAYTWKVTSCDHVPFHLLVNFATALHVELEKLIPKFYSTVGGCPSHILLLPDFFTSIVTTLGNCNTHLTALNVSVVKIFETFVNAKMQRYLDKVMSEIPSPSPEAREKELRKVQRYHVRGLIYTYPSYTASIKKAFSGLNNFKDMTHDLYRVGICYEENGQLKFFHDMYAEFVGAQYYVDSGRLKNTSNLYIGFFLNRVLFDQESKQIRKFFESYLAMQQERHHVRETIVWNRLRVFLLNHYKLFDDNEDKSGVTYEDIRHKGSILNIIIMEGNFKLFQMILDSFKGNNKALKRLLEITIEMEIYDENPFENDIPPEKVNMDCFQMLAMFGNAVAPMGKFISAWYLLFGEPYMDKYFSGRSVVHLAGMNSNCNFLEAALRDRRVLEWRDEKGRTAIHGVQTKNWFYSIKLYDRPHPTDTRVCFPQKPNSMSSESFLAIQEAIDAVSGKPKPKRNQNGQPKKKKAKIQRKPDCEEKEIWCFGGVNKQLGGEWETKDGEMIAWNPIQPQLKTFDILFSKGANINAKEDIHGRTVLHNAVISGDEVIVEYLLNKGALVKITDKYGKTARDYAGDVGNMRIIGMLLEREGKEHSTELEELGLKLIQINKYDECLYF